MGTPARSLLPAAALLAAGRAEAYLVPGMKADLLAIVNDPEDAKDAEDARTKVEGLRETSAEFEEVSRAYKPRVCGGTAVAPPAGGTASRRGSTPAYAPTLKVKEWHGESGEMAAEARGPIAALKAGGPDAVKKAATRVNDNRANDHETYRDN